MFGLSLAPLRAVGQIVGAVRQSADGLCVKAALQADEFVKRAGNAYVKGEEAVAIAGGKVAGAHPGVVTKPASWVEQAWMAALPAPIRTRLVDTQKRVADLKARNAARSLVRTPLADQPDLHLRVKEMRERIAKVESAAYWGKPGLQKAAAIARWDPRQVALRMESWLYDLIPGSRRVGVSILQELPDQLINGLQGIKGTRP